LASSLHMMRLPDITRRLDRRNGLGLTASPWIPVEARGRTCPNLPDLGHRRASDPAPTVASGSCTARTARNDRTQARG
jgi:hypothetical protein